MQDMETCMRWQVKPGTALQQAQLFYQPGNALQQAQLFYRNARCSIGMLACAAWRRGTAGVCTEPEELAQCFWIGGGIGREKCERSLVGHEGCK